MIRLPPRSTRLPYPALFRSLELDDRRLDLPRRHVDLALAPAPLPLRHLGVAHQEVAEDRKSTRLNSSHANISYAVFCLKKKPEVHQVPSGHCITTQADFQLE